MKFLHFLLLFFAFPLSAQTTFESPYVFEGKTLQFEIPKGFKLAEPFSDEEILVYALDTAGFSNIDFYEMDEWPIPKGIFYTYASKTLWEEELNLQELADNLEEVLYEIGDAYLVEDPVYSVRQNFPFFTATFTYEGDMVLFDQVNLSAIDFGDYFFFIGTFTESHKDSGLMSYLDEAMSKSITIVETDKENALIPWEEMIHMTESYSVHSKIESDDLKFRKESSNFWTDGYPETYLRHFDYGPPNAQIQGSVMLFSAGVDTDSLDDNALLEVLKSAYERYPIESVKSIGTVTGEHFTFKKYSVSGNELTTKFVKQIYTTPFEGELLIIIVKRGEYTTNTFTASYETFVKSLYPLKTVKEESPPPPTSRQ